MIDNMETYSEEIKRALKWVWIVFIVLAIFLSVEALAAFKNLRGVNPAYNSISVSGEGEAFSVPDIATFSFAVSADAQIAGDAQEEVTKKMDIILTGLEDLGIEEKDIKTTNYSLRPKYTFTPTICSQAFCPPSRQIQDGYTASHDVSVKVRSTEDAGKALALAGENGATGISNISFTIDDPERIMDEARTEAIKDAKAKAKRLSKELGVKLVRVVSFHDNTGGGPMPYYAEAMGGDMIKTTGISVPTIPIGENKVTVNVTIVYEIR